MLTHVQLRDLVIVDAAELEFGRGLTALTGETGAGKSIVVDALLLIAGGRATAGVVRQGAERAEISASFAELPSAAEQWLAAQSIEHDGEVIVRRVIGADGRSRSYVNGQLVPLQALRELGEFLLEIHGQQEFQHLIKRDAQRAMLDEHLGSPQLLEEVERISAAARVCQREYTALRSAADNRDARLELLRYQLTEMKSEVTSVAALEALFANRKRIAGRGRLGAVAQTALLATYEADSGSAHDSLAKAAASLRSGDADPTLEAAAQLLADATILVQEAAQALRHYLDALDVDPATQEEIERQAAVIEALARKHRVAVLELPAQRARLEQELSALESADLRLAEFTHRLAALTRDYDAAAQKLSAARGKAAVALGDQITQLMQTLGMSGGRFAVSLEPNGAGFAPTGSDSIEFLVSANPGQSMQDLAKVASGGELSRISLAVQVAGAAGSSPLCMVFDEVDAGIGGGIAEIVGRQLRDLGERAQVLCVTHLPQVAAQAHSHFKVVKRSDGKSTRTWVEPLSKADRVDEIARMLGGVAVTAQARAHAREMLRLTGNVT